MSAYTARRIAYVLIGGGLMGFLSIFATVPLAPWWSKLIFFPSSCLAILFKNFLNWPASIWNSEFSIMMGITAFLYWTITLLTYVFIFRSKLIAALCILGIHLFLGVILMVMAFDEVF